MQTTLRPPSQTGLPMASAVSQHSTLVALCQAASPSLDGENSKQNQAPALVESAQSAIENIAFQYVRTKPTISENYADQAWFACDDSFDACISRGGLSLKARIYSGGHSMACDIAISPSKARQLAATLLNAADFAELNPNFGKVAA